MIYNETKILFDKKVFFNINANSKKTTTIPIFFRAFSLFLNSSTAIKNSSNDNEISENNVSEIEKKRTKASSIIPTEIRKHFQKVLACLPPIKFLKKLINRYIDRVSKIVSEIIDISTSEVKTTDFSNNTCMEYNNTSS